MKIIDDGSSDIPDSPASSSESASTAPSPARSPRRSPKTSYKGRNLAVAEKSGLADLLRAYASSDLAQIRALTATSEVFVQDVAYFIGLKGSHPDSIYEFASLAESVARRSTTDPLAADVSADREPEGEHTAPDSADDSRTGTKPRGKTSVDKKRAPGRGRKKDRAAGRRLRRERKLMQQRSDNPPPLPDFPGFKAKTTFDCWAHLHAQVDDLGEYSSLLGTNIGKTYRHLTSAVTLVHGLPQFLRRCLDGDFTIEHVDYVARRCRNVNFENLPAIDDFLAARRADVTVETFCRSLALRIAAIQPQEETLEKVSLRRRVDISTGDDGTAYLTLTGPAPELHACYKRIEAFARAVYRGNTGAFAEQLKPGDEFDDDRLISALMFDIYTRTRPQLKLRITSNNTTTGESASTDFPLDELFAGPDGIPRCDGESLLDYIERAFDEMDKGAGTAESPSAEEPTDAGDASTGSGSENDTTFTPFTPASRAFESQILDALLNATTTIGSTSAEALFSLIGSAKTKDFKADAFGHPISSHDAARRCRISCEVVLDMPTNEYWLAQQARTIITVPLLTLLSQYLAAVDGDGTAPPFEEVASPPTNSRHTGSPPTSSPPTSSPPTDSPPNEAPPSRPSCAPHGSPPAADVCDLAGMLPDGSPVPAEMARRVAGYASTWTRLLTDPATGTPVDAKATTYTIPNSIRQTLIAQFITCTFPGCTLPADKAEIDHIQPFDHADPSQGGLTRFGNLHCLCKQHHQAKTDGKFDVRMTEPGHLEYVFRRGTTAEVVHPDNPLNVEHARLFLRCLAGSRPKTSTLEPTDEASQNPAESAPDSSASSTDSDQHRHGERVRSRKRPGPATAPGEPGWSEYTAPGRFIHADDQNGELEWFWDSGDDEPPF